MLSGVDLRCGDSEVAVIEGENGAGKSTLLRVVAGLLEPDRGTVHLVGAPVHGGGVEARRHLGYMPDGVESLPDLLVGELLVLVSALKQAPPLPAGLVERAGMAPLRRQRLSALSFGQRKRALLLAALVGDPWLLILDEPTNGLDPEGIHLLQEILQERRAAGKGVLLATNDRSFASSLRASVHRLRAGRLDRSDR